MDNIFGKEDSGNESEHIDIDDKEEKYNHSQNSGSKDAEPMDADNIQVKVYSIKTKIVILFCSIDFEVQFIGFNYR